MVNKERKIISVEKESADLDTTLKNALERIQYLIKTYGEDAVLENTSDMYDDSGTTYLKVFAKEPETDEQMKKRIELETQYELAREKRDEAEFERLQKKYDSKKRMFDPKK